MTRKHYKLIADAIRFTTHCSNENGVDCVVVDALIRDLCRALKSDNSGFKPERFTEACGK